MSNKSELLIKNYETSVNDILKLFMQKHAMEYERYGYWVGDEVGGTYSTDGEEFISFNDMLFDIREDLEPSKYLDYIEYLHKIISVNITVKHDAIEYPSYREYVLSDGSIVISDERLKGVEEKYLEFQKLLEESLQSN